MSWIKCPICDGTGKVLDIPPATTTCPTCEGRRIISELTGLPPKKPEITVKPKENDTFFREIDCEAAKRSANKFIDELREEAMKKMLWFVEKEQEWRKANDINDNIV